MTCRIVSSLPGCPAVGALWNVSMICLFRCRSGGTAGCESLSHCSLCVDPNFVSLYASSHSFISEWCCHWAQWTLELSIDMVVRLWMKSAGGIMTMSLL